MKQFKTATIFILLLIIISIIIYFLPIQNLLSNIPFVKDIYNNTSITINSKNGKSVVKINGKDYGETPVSVNNLSEGDYIVEISRISTTTDFYLPKTISFYLERGTEAIIDYEIGPAGINSGYLLYYTKSFVSSKSTGYISINGVPDNADIYMDDEYFGKNTQNAVSLNAKNYQLKAVSKGYEDLSFPIIIRNGYNLNVLFSLYPIPINITE